MKKSVNETNKNNVMKMIRNIVFFKKKNDHKSGQMKEKSEHKL